MNSNNRLPYRINDNIKSGNMKTKTIFWIAAMFLFLSGGFHTYAQNIITSGTYMIITGSSNVISTQDLDVNSGGNITVNGTLKLKKDFINLNSGPSNIGTGIVEFSGTTGQNIIQDLTLSNSAGLTIGGNTRVNGNLTLTSGIVTLGSNNLLLGPSAVVAGSPSASAMVVPSSTGEMRKEYAGTGSFTYPVGDATGTPEYSPVTLNFTSGTFASGNDAGVSLADAQYPGTATSYLTRYWNVTQSGITGFSCNSTFQYVPADVVGTESDIFCFKVDPSLPWIAYNATNTATHQLTAHGLSSFGTFTGNLGDGAVPPAIRSLQDKIIPNGTVACADATQTLIIAGNGTTYLVQNGGSVSHIAGQNILYEPGAKVESGGYMHGYISTTFCSPYVHPLAPTLTDGTGDQVFSPNTTNSLFRIYPNPTPGIFTLELKGDIASSQVHIDIFGIQGDRILSKDLLIERKQEFSLIDRPTGMYVIHVTSGANSETEKIIKQ